MCLVSDVPRKTGDPGTTEVELGTLPSKVKKVGTERVLPKTVLSVDG